MVLREKNRSALTGTSGSRFGKQTDGHSPDVSQVGLCPLLHLRLRRGVDARNFRLFVSSQISCSFI